MASNIKEKNVVVKDLLNSTFAAIETVIPLKHHISKPQLSKDPINLSFGVLIGITGHIKGKLMLTGELSTFAQIGETMFGMPVEGEMLTSFSGELGNMLAGNISTNIVEKGFNIDITYPSIIQGSTKILGYKQAIKLCATFENTGDMDIYLLLD